TEGNFGDAPHVVQALAERAANEAGGRPQTCDSFLALVISAEDSHVDAAMAQVRRHLHSRHRGEANAGILNLPLNDFTELDSQLFFDSIDSSSKHVGSHNLDIALNHALRRDSLCFFRRFGQY